MEKAKWTFAKCAQKSQKSPKHVEHGAGTKQVIK